MSKYLPSMSFIVKAFIAVIIANTVFRLVPQTKVWERIG